MPDQHDATAVDPRQAAHNRRIIREGAIAGERNEVVRDAGDIILEMRALGVARDLRLLPRRQLRIGVAEQLGGLRFQLGDLRIDVDVVGTARRLL
jgi:hypothetical protein